MKRIKKIIILLIILIFFINTCIHANNEIEWKEWQKEDYWEWYTRTTREDKAYNGNHIVMQKDVIDFYGYWQNSYKDFLFKQYDNEGKKIFRFRIDETRASYHTLDGAGFIVNANKTENQLSGYIILFREKDVCLYRIDNIDINTFQNKSNSSIETYAKLIVSKPKINSNIHDLIVEATPTKIKVTEGNTEIINIDLEYSKHIGNSFGLISSYVQHACEILSKIQFSELKIELEDFEIPILNTDLDGIKISGGYFEIQDEQGNIIKQEKTDKNGKIKIIGIKQGKYTVKQISAPETYILNNNIYEFEIKSEGKIVDSNSGEEIELVIKNEQYKIEINNKEYTGIVNEDGTVEFENEDKNTIYNEEKEKEEKVEILNNIEYNEEDNTTSKTSIPKAGSNFNIFMMGIILSIIFSIISFLKIKK